LSGEIWKEFMIHVSKMMKENPDGVPMKDGKKVNHMAYAASLRDSKDPIYVQFITSKGHTVDEIEASKKPMKPKKTDEEKAAEKLAKLEAKAAKPAKPRASKKAAAVAAVASPTTPAEAESTSIDFQLNGKSYTRLDSGETWEVLSNGDLSWAGIYDPVSNKIDSSVPEPTA
jgi:TPP-dependent indolepyruvate ferredoxin oxidoreductase alpha subunit